MHSYENAKSLLKGFILSIEGTSDSTIKLKYMNQLESIRCQKSKIFKVDLDDLLKYCQDEEFVETIADNAYRFIKMIDALVDQALARTETLKFDVSSSEELSANTGLSLKQTNWRQCMQPIVSSQGHRCTVSNQKHETQLLHLSQRHPLPLRSLRASDLGKLVRIRGIVTRSSGVKPIIDVAAYVCEKCGSRTFQDLTYTASFTPVASCSSTLCRKQNACCTLNSQNSSSRFIKYQEIRLQELPEQVPVGHIPRSAVAHCKGELTRKCSPGARPEFHVFNRSLPAASQAKLSYFR